MEPIREIKKYPGGAPKPRLKDIEELEDQFTKYVFYKKESKYTHVITTCCHKDTKIDNMPRLLTPQLNLFLNWKKHNRETVCPLCGATVTAKAMGRVSENLYEGIRFTFLAQRKGTLYSIHGYACRKGLEKDISACIEQTLKYEVGHVTEHSAAWYSKMMVKHEYSGYDFKNNPQRISSGYVIGKDVLEKTPFKYIPFNWRWGEVNRQFTLAAFYPKQMEMLLKLGWKGIVYDMLFNRRKNAAIFNWDAKDQKKAWKISKELVQEFRADDAYCMWQLREYLRWQKIDRRITLNDVCTRGSDLDKIKKLLIKVDVCKTLKYLEKAQDKHLYRDYIDMARECERDLTVPNILYPKDLRHAHDELVKETNLKRERIKNEKEKETLAKMWETLDNRSKKYNFAYNGFFARVALSAAEVRREGCELRHCVGGYAERHVANQLTIIFVRKMDAPNASLYTVEVAKDGHIVQAHGYRNEFDGQPAPLEAIPEFFEAWQYWYNHGSKRDKNGNPIIRKKYRKEAA